MSEKAPIPDSFKRAKNQEESLGKIGSSYAYHRSTNHRQVDQPIQTDSEARLKEKLLSCMSLSIRGYSSLGEGIAKLLLELPTHRL